MSKKTAKILKIGAMAAGIGVTLIPVGGPIVGAIGLGEVSGAIAGGGIDMIAGHFLGKIGDKIQNGADHAIDDASKTKKEKEADKAKVEKATTEKEQTKLSKLAGGTHNSNGRSVSSTLDKFNQDNDQIKQNQPSYIDQLLKDAGNGAGIASNVGDAKAQAHEL